MTETKATDKVPISIVELLKLSECDVPADEVTWQRVSMPNDRWVCIRHEVARRRKTSKSLVSVQRTGEQVVTVAHLGLGGLRLGDRTNAKDGHLAITCQSAKMNPVRALLCALTGRLFSVYDLDSKNHPIVSKYVAKENVIFWNWLSESVIGFLTRRGVFFWHTAPTKFSTFLFDFVRQCSVTSQQSGSENCISPPGTPGDDSVRYICALDPRFYGKQIVQLKADSAMRWVAVTALFEDDSAEFQESGDHAETAAGLFPDAQNELLSVANNNRASAPSSSSTSLPQANSRRHDLSRSFSADANVQATPIHGIVQLYSVADKITQCITDAHCVEFASYRFSWNTAPSTVLLLVTRGGATNNTSKLHVIELQPIAPGNLAPTQHSDSLPLNSADRANDVLYDIAVSIVCSKPQIGMESNKAFFDANEGSASRRPSSSSQAPNTNGKRKTFASLGEAKVDELKRCSLIDNPVHRSNGNIQLLVDFSESDSNRLYIPAPPRSPASLSRRRGQQMLLAVSSNQMQRRSLALPSFGTQESLSTGSSTNLHEKGASYGTEERSSARMLPLPPPPPPRRSIDFNSQSQRAQASPTSTADKYGFVYVVTKYGQVHVCDIESSATLFTVRVANVGDVVFAATNNCVTHGLLCATRSGKILTVDLKDDKLVPFLMGSCRNKHGVANRVARQLSASANLVLPDLLLEM